MKILNRNKLEEQCITSCDRYYGEDDCEIECHYGDGFIDGAIYAEKELVSIAIQFAEWIDADENYFYTFNPDKGWYKIGIGYANTIEEEISSEELFNRFLKTLNQ